jgi:hypothetical protein
MVSLDGFHDLFSANGEFFPFPLEGLSPRRNRLAVIFGQKRSHSYQTIWDDPGEKHPDNQINPGSIKPVQIVVLEFPPVRFDYHSCF